MTQIITADMTALCYLLFGPSVYLAERDGLLDDTRVFLMSAGRIIGTVRKASDGSICFECGQLAIVMGDVISKRRNPPTLNGRPVKLCCSNGVYYATLEPLY